MRRQFPAAAIALSFVALAAALVLGPAAGKGDPGDRGGEAPACVVSPAPAGPLWSVSAAQTAGGDLLLVDTPRERILRLSKVSGDWAPLGGPLGRTVEGSWPAALHPAGGGMLLELAAPEHRIVRLDGDLRPGPGIEVLDRRSAGGERIRSTWIWEAAGDGEIVACSDLSRRARDGSEEPVATTAFLRVPLGDPAAFVSLYRAPLEAPLRLACRLGLPLIASLESTAFVLAPAGDGEPVRIYRHAPGEPARALAAFPAAFERWPDLPVEVCRERYAALWRRIEGATMPVGLFGWEGALYLLARQPAGEGTAWSLVKIDPAADRVLGAMRLDSRAPDLLVAPGRDSWAVVEKGPALALGDQELLRVIHLPADRLRDWRPGGTLCAGLDPVPLPDPLTLAALTAAGPSDRALRCE